MSDSDRIKDIRFDFSHFLWHNLMEIHELESQGRYVDALVLSVDLVKYLPVVVRVELEEDANEIKHKIKMIDGDFSGKHHFVSRLMKTRRKNALAKKMLDNFIRKMIGLLDERGYLEKRFPHLTLKDFPEVDA